MIYINKNADTAIIVIHEIYGVNQHMKDMCAALAEQNFNVICPNLLDQEITFDYTQEDFTYKDFMEKVGFANASRKVFYLLSNIKNQYKKVFIVGFSVGATIAWLCSEEKGLSGVVGYYGSRIRDYVEISPQCPTMLFFPKEEKSFSIDELISKLNKDHIEVHKFNGQHGFSDLYSSKYNEEAAQKSFRKMNKFFLEH